MRSRGYPGFERLAACVTIGLALTGTTATAQESSEPQPPATTSEQSDTGWLWAVDSNTFFGFNYQYRKFRDFNAWESQNWLMASGERSGAGGSLRVSSMFSLEAWTLKDLGSPQAFQTGETFRGAPLIDYQHPHDLIMGLGTEYRGTIRGLLVLAGADLVGTPTLGPPVFMHRQSAENNPQAPLSHHYMDSTHTTPGVIRAGVERSGWRLEGSWFHGREPDENRTDVDLGALDSYAARLSWTRGPWSAQISEGWLAKPEAITPFDAKKLTASVAYTSGSTERSLAWLFAFGQKREIHGNLEAYLFEANLRATTSDTFYTRIESVAKDILDAGFHLGGFHRHRQSQVGALTVGYMRRVLTTPAGWLGVGGDVTGYAVPANLQEPYGSPVSFHVFMQYRLGNRHQLIGGPTHVH